MKCTTASYASTLIVQCMIFGRQKRYLEKSTFYLSIWHSPVLSKTQSKWINSPFIQLINTLGSCLLMSIDPPEQVKLFLCSTLSEYKLTDSLACQLVKEWIKYWYLLNLFDLIFFFFFWFGFYGPFKNISLISSRSFIEGGRKPENPEKNHLTIRKQNLAFPHMARANFSLKIQPSWNDTSITILWRNAF